MRAVRRAEWIALILILIFAAVLRVGAPGVSEFKRDEANLSALALDLARGQSFPLTGIGSSVGIPNTPVSVWLTAIPYLFSSDPLVATVYIGLLNVIAVGLLWLFARRYFGGLAALIAALLLACSPWMVIYSRKIWAQNMLAPFVVAVVFSGVLGFLEGRRRWQVAHIALLALTIQIHYSAFVLIPVSAAFILIGQRNIRRELWIGVALAILLVLPFGVGVLRAGLDGFRSPSTGERAPLTIDDKALYHAALMISGTEIHSLAGEQQYQNYLASVPNLFPFLNIIAVLGLLGAAFLFLRGDTLRRVIVLWAILPVIVFSVRWTATYPHYLLPMLPAAFLLIGIVCNELSKTRALRYAAIAATLLIVVTQSGLLIALLHFVNVTATPGGFGTPLHYLQMVRDGLRGAPDVIVYSNGDSTVYDETPAVWNILLHDFPSVRFVNITRMIVLTKQGVYLANAIYRPQMEQSSAQITDTFPMRGDELPIMTFRPPAAFPIAPDAMRASNAETRLQNGVLLRAAWAEIRNGNTLRLYSQWQLERDGKGEPTLYSVFNQLEADGKRIGQQDGAFWAMKYWRAGDQVLVWYDVPIDPSLQLDDVQWRIGMYLNENGTLRGVDVLDAAGNPAGQSITLTFQ
jgi:4-amino-4-deoxy-L-arabinose transferase-like glycosyltransferase